MGTWTTDDTLLVSASDPTPFVGHTMRLSRQQVSAHGDAWLEHTNARQLLSSNVLLALAAPPAAVAVVVLDEPRSGRAAALVLVWCHEASLPAAVRDDVPLLRKLTVGPLAAPTLGTSHDTVRLAAIMSVLPHGIAFVDEQRVEALVNTAAAQWLRVPTGAIAANAFATAMRELQLRVRNSDDVRADSAILASGIDVSLHDRLWELQDPAGVVLRVSSVPVRHDAESGRLWTFEDISLERSLMHEMSQYRELELKLRQAQKLEAVGRLAAGLAHDFNNLLTVISGSAELLRAAALTEQERTDLRDIDGATTRARRLTRQLLTFTSRQVEHPQVLDLDAHLRDIAPLLSKVLAPDAQLSLDWHAAGVHVLADPRSLELAVLNLLANARDAMGPGGQARLRTSLRELRDVVAHGSALPLRGPHAVISLEDSGCGMDAVTLGRIFEPFFTTKPEGYGTGLGLATVLAIAQRAGGGVLVESSVGVGTRIDILLPCVDAQVSAISTVLAPAAPIASPAHSLALLVDDEAAPRRAVQRLLQHIGFDVITASSAMEARRIVAQGDHAIDVIISDHMMPGMSGYQLVQHLRADKHETPVLLISGFVEDASLAADLAAQWCGFLGKPFSVEELVAAIQSLVPVALR